MTEPRKRLVRRLVVLYVLAGLASMAYRFLDRRAVARDADDARSAATASASPATTPDDARRWLETNGYRVILWNPHDPRGFVGYQSGTGGDFVIVQGQRQIRHGKWVGKPTWLNVTFRFTFDRAFHDVEADQWPFPAPATRPAA
jgi:hypothetical protein